MTLPQIPHAPDQDLGNGPLCPNGHGPMVKRPEVVQNVVQRWCGEWWDCAPSPRMCTSAMLYPSAALLEQLALERSLQGND